MSRYEYKVVPAPVKAPRKAAGAKTSEDRFAHGLEALINKLAADGWQYQRAEMLPQEERSGLTGSATTYRNVLIFCRPSPLDTYRAEVMDVDTPQETPMAAVSTEAQRQRLGPARGPAGGRGPVLTARKGEAVEDEAEDLAQSDTDHTKPAS
ncbi:DUF4177 domain-containing protein [Pseudooceanicola algae]|uniref:DUF4177 domain-containing protein n=1 Tax=Pseudooceanicola algae TaxID=1537215 RepID=A0A418SF87_9RHOB|nr:DUF4177 domain-containing protein [Pseudooceanicola algae]QPM89242.1 hypothetical protein PSAL_004570 [Pseudooceanicola algae]